MQKGLALQAASTTMKLSMLCTWIKLIYQVSVYAVWAHASFQGLQQTADSYAASVYSMTMVEIAVVRYIEYYKGVVEFTVAAMMACTTYTHIHM